MINNVTFTKEALNTTLDTLGRLQEAVKQAQDSNRYLAEGLPDKAKTDGQRALQRVHGTPKEFAEACINAIGEISVLEAHVAVNKYHQQWNAA